MNRVFTVASILACVGAACSPPTTLQVAQQLTWAPVAEPVDWADDSVEMPVAPGQIVRFGASKPLAVREVLRTRDGVVEVGRTLIPTQGAAFLRVGVSASSLRFLRRHLAGVRMGAVSSPEYGWFSIESAALAWADGPIGQPFPRLSESPRWDQRTLETLDEVVQGALSSRSNSAIAHTAATALRRLVASRIVNMMQGFRGHPYAISQELTPDGELTLRRIDDADFMAVDAANPVTVTLDGPTELLVRSRIPRASGEQHVALSVMEGSKVRGRSESVVKSASSASGARTGEDADLVFMRTVHVHVPPGRHALRIQTTTPQAYLQVVTSKPVVRIEDRLGGSRGEESWTLNAVSACEADGLGAICLLARALTWSDLDQGYARLYASQPQPIQGLADELAQSGMFDRTSSLENRSANGDALAIAELGTT